MPYRVRYDSFAHWVRRMVVSSAQLLTALVKVGTLGFLNLELASSAIRWNWRIEEKNRAD